MISSARSTGVVSFGAMGVETGRRNAAFLFFRRAVPALTCFEVNLLTARCLDLTFAAINSCSTLVNRLDGASKLAAGNCFDGRAKNNSAPAKKITRNEARAG